MTAMLLHAVWRFNIDIIYDKYVSLKHDRLYSNILEHDATLSLGYFYSHPPTFISSCSPQNRILGLLGKDMTSNFDLSSTLMNYSIPCTSKENMPSRHYIGSLKIVWWLLNPIQQLLIHFCFAEYCLCGNSVQQFWTYANIIVKWDIEEIGLGPSKIT